VLKKELMQLGKKITFEKCEKQHIELKKAAGDSDQPMTESEIYSYEAFKSRIYDELRNIDRTKIGNLSKDNVTEYLIKLRRQKQNLVNLEDERILETQGMCQNAIPTLAGLMLLSQYPQEFLPQLSVTAMLVQGKEIGELGDDDERFIDNKRIEGTIPQMIEATLAFVRRNVNHPRLKSKA
jgi:ATP-dependent DNA helicase RecG